MDVPSPEDTSSSIRSPVTETERQVLNTVQSELSNRKTAFYCTGKLDSMGVKNPRIYYTIPGGGEEEKKRAGSLSVSSKIPEEYVALHDSCKPSHFGVGNKAVMDESYRTARDLPSEDFALNFDPIHPSLGVLGRVSATTSKQIQAVRYKLNSYTAGGFFKAHQDTPKAENHMGTLLFGIPSTFTGGELVLRHEGLTVTLDWSQESGISWVFFYADIEHEILPVTSGNRVTVAYDIFILTDEPKPMEGTDQLAVDVTTLPLYNIFRRDILHNPTFRPEGCRLAFPLRHAYPLSEDGWSQKFASTLKGEDAILLKTLQELHLETRLVAVYKVSDYDYDDYGENPGGGRGAILIDEFSPATGGHWNTAFLTADSFEGIQGEYVDTSEVYALQDQVGAKLEPDVIWCTKPGTFVVASTYVAYGNEPSNETSYVAAAIIVSVPAIGTGMRVQQ